MHTDSRLPMQGSQPGQPWAPRFFRRSSTRLGWWAVGLGAAFVVLFIVNSGVLMQLTERPPWSLSLLIGYGFAMLLCGLASGIAGLMAVLRHERSWLVWITLLPGLLVVFLLLGEFLVPH
ncbi:MAG: hypothetical protein ABI847_18010 [Anaerolineales bacterium]